MEQPPADCGSPPPHQWEKLNRTSKLSTGTLSRTPLYPRALCRANHGHFVALLPKNHGHFVAQTYIQTPIASGSARCFALLICRKRNKKLRAATRLKDKKESAPSGRLNFFERRQNGAESERSPSGRAALRAAQLFLF
jgi:hypothetical protein